MLYVSNVSIDIFYNYLLLCNYIYFDTLVDT